MKIDTIRTGISQNAFIILILHANRPLHMDCISILQYLSDIMD